MSMLKRSWFWWWGWKPEKVEDWLEEMELKGWNLYHVDLGSIRFQFKKGETRKLRYCADFQMNTDDQYFKLFADDGWELVWKGTGGWFIWKKSYTNGRPEIYTDSKSLIERNARLIKTLSSVVGGLLPIFLLLLTFYRNNGFINYVIWFYIFIFAFNGYVLLQLKRQNKKLRQNNIRY